ncbi:MAG: thiamine phosphate synthase [Hyphomonadaceae bacterium]
MSAVEAQPALRRKLAASARAMPVRFARNGERLPPAWFLTDPARTPDPVAIVGRLPAGWGVIYRSFGAPDRFDLGRRLKAVCARRRLRLLVSADPELAMRIGADGVHWPEALARPRGLRRRGWIETCSAHGRRSIERAARLGFDAAILSAVFPSRSPSAGDPIGPGRFRSLAATAPLPVYALGGVTARTAGLLTGANADDTRLAGWAAVEAVAEAFG